MTEYHFDSSNFVSSEAAGTPSSFLSSSNAQLTPNMSAESNSQDKQRGNLASFICHVVYLEKALRDDGTSIFLNEKIEADSLGTKLGEGSQFSVFRAESKYKKNWKTFQAQRWGEFVAVKTVKPTVRSSAASNDWSSILLEVRSLLHPFLRYHPNIVRLLAFSWSSGNGSTSIYPVLVMEYAKYGSLSALQKSAPRLRVQVKQKLCYDIARGLAILHACGIVHGDLKHENVLVFENPYDEPKDQPYLAKLADFGGAAMDTSSSTLKSLILGTFPYDAPEAAKVLSAEGLKKTDVYSFGLLVWRTLLDGKDLRQELNLANCDVGHAKILIRLFKQEDKMLEVAIHSVTTYSTENGIYGRVTDMILYALHKTIMLDPMERSLPHAQAALQGMQLDKIDDFINKTTIGGERFQANRQGDGIRRRTIDVDSIGFNLGKLGDFYDAQENLPGYRQDLPHPEKGEFLFEPLKLKHRLTWIKQEQIVEELKAAARSQYGNSAVEVQPFRAAYYIFQSYLAGFGVNFDAQEACYWLHQASKKDEDGTVEYFAQAWLWRICNALDCPQPTTTDALLQNIKLSIMRGHRICVSDSKCISERLPSTDERTQFEKEVVAGQEIFLTIAGGVGMPHYAGRKLRKNWNLDNLHILDAQILEELGDKFSECLRTTTSQNEDLVKAMTDSPFNKLFVNHVGHSLLHYAATFGKLDALKHLISTYKCNINVENELSHETPLLCAVRSVQYACAVFLLDAGASPGKTKLGEEGALHWLSAFEMQQHQIEPLATKLVEAGADLEETCGSGIQGIFADWEGFFNIPTTPLGRAVILRSVPTVRVLLGLGANPRAKGTYQRVATKSALELAAVLMYPEILELLLRYLDQTPQLEKHVFDETWILQAAHEKSITNVDPTTLQSRLVRLGSQYKSAVFETLRILHERHQKTQTWQNTELAAPPGRQLCIEIGLGNRDIVEALLKLDHDPNGSVEFRPLEAAVSTNNSDIFRLLLNFGADITKGFTIRDGEKYSLLQLLASRPQTSLPGSWIAEYLIKSELPIEPIRNGSPSAFALAVENQYFELADLLLAAGADVNIVYQRPDKNSQAKSLLGNLITDCTERSLASIRYLASLNSRAEHATPKPPAHSSSATDPFSMLQAQLTALSVNPSTKTSLTPLAIPSLQMTIFHQTAWWTHDFVSANLHTATSIIELLLDAFPDPKVIDQVHPILGTPLCIAAMSSNLEMITALLGRNASVTIAVDVEACYAIFSATFGITRKPEHGAPVWLALAVYESLLGRDGTATSEKLDVSERVLSKLLPVSKDDGAETRWKVLREKRVSLDEERREGMVLERKQIGEVDCEVVDLSVMTEEKPSGWKEGEDSSEEMAMRTFLRFMRRGE